MITKRIKKMQGQILITSLVFLVILTLLVAVVGIILTNEKKHIESQKIRTDSAYSLESAEQLAKIHLEEFATAQFATLVKNATSASTPVIKDPSLLFKGIDGPDVLTVIPETTYSLTGFKKSDSINSELTATGGRKIKNANPLSYQYLFCYDADNNFECSSEEIEDSFYLLNRNMKGGDKKNEQIYDYQYKYTVYSFYGKPDTEKNKRTNVRKIVKSGMVTLSATPEYFSKFALATNVHKGKNGDDIWFTDNTSFDGPVHTNAKDGSMFRFAGNSQGKSAKFTGKVTSAGKEIEWYNNGFNKTETPPVSNLNPKNGSRDIPTFEKGYQRDVEEIEFPDDTFNQESAALGGDYTDLSALSNSKRRQELGLTENNYPVPEGIYLPTEKDTDSLKGGIYIKGDVDELILAVSEDNNQQYIIQQGDGNDKVTKMIEVNEASDKTIVTVTQKKYLSKTVSSCWGKSNCTCKYGVCTQSSYEDVTTTEELSGTPNGALYVEGDIKFMGGPPRVPEHSSKASDAHPAIQSNTELTVVATGDIVIQRDIKYQTNPVGPDGKGGTADDNPDAKNVLGIYTSKGDVRIGKSAPNNLAVHASIMASDDNGVFTVDGYNSGPDRGPVTLVGGVISGRYGAFGTFSNNGVRTGYGRDFVYDRRFEKGKAPPFFPTFDDLASNPSSVASEITTEEIFQYGVSN